MDVTLTFNGADFSPWLSTYQVEHEITYRKVIKTMDNEEHFANGSRRPVITFSLLPVTDAMAAEYCAALSALSASATYTDPWLGGNHTAEFRVVSDLSAAFGLKSADGKRYYKGGQIRLRAAGVL